MGLQIQGFECNSETHTHYYLCNYRPKSHGPDELSESLLRFKNGYPLHVDAWTECCISEFSTISVNRNCLVIRALSSTEEVAALSSNTPMDILGRKLASKYHVHYDPTLLKKTRQTRKVKFLSANEREDELSDVYEFAEDATTDKRTEIFILDDILTTGSTMRSIIKAIRSVLAMCRIQIFTLACTDQQALINQNIQLNSYSYTWESQRGWNMVEEKKGCHSMFASLKSKILNDSFD